MRLHGRHGGSGPAFAQVISLPPKFTTHTVAFEVSFLLRRLESQHARHAERPPQCCTACSRDSTALRSTKLKPRTTTSSCVSQAALASAMPFPEPHAARLRPPKVYIGTKIFAKSPPIYTASRTRALLMEEAGKVSQPRCAPALWETFPCLAGLGVACWRPIRGGYYKGVWTRARVRSSEWFKHPNLPL